MMKGINLGLYKNTKRRAILVFFIKDMINLLCSFCSQNSASNLGLAHKVHPSLKAPPDSYRD